LNEGGIPNDSYIEFMKTGTGPGVLAIRLRDVYRPLFEAAHAPQNEPDDELRKLFHIHTGGGDDVMRLQIQTFKALADQANFADTAIPDGKDVGGSSAVSKLSANTDGPLPPVQIALHIHLPENKTTRDYEAIIQDIAKYIYGRPVGGN
jgi:hypothetical protein